MNKNEIIIFKDDNLELEVNVSPEDDTVWLTQRQISKIFNIDRSRISRHINNIYGVEELYKYSTSAESAQVPKWNN